MACYAGPPLERILRPSLPQLSGSFFSLLTTDELVVTNLTVHDMKSMRTVGGATWLRCYEPQTFLLYGHDGTHQHSSGPQGLTFRYEKNYFTHLHPHAAERYRRWADAG